ncbi:MAG: hypothetical protein AABW71_00360 [Nanoarchaeota archaeon]|mgnify:CR=1
MNIILEVIEKTGKNLLLTSERWAHIRKDHPEVELEEIERALIKPINLIKINDEKYYYFHYFKHKKISNKLLRVIVKYKSNKWLIMTAHFVHKMHQNE